MKPSDVKYFNTVMKYFFDTTKTSFEEYTSMVGDMIYTDTKTKQSSDYRYWLLARCLEMLDERGISRNFCIEQKDSLREYIIGLQSAQEGEYYTPELWCKEGRKYLKGLVGDLWGTAAVWDCACYTMDTEIYTARGWLTYDQLLNDDLVYSLNPQTREGEWVPFVQKFTRRHVGNLVHFKGDKIDLTVTPDHSMYFLTSGGGNSDVLRLDAGDVKGNLGRMQDFNPYIPIVAKMTGVDKTCDKSGSCTEKYAKYEYLFEKAMPDVCKCKLYSAMWVIAGAYYANGSLRKGTIVLDLTRSLARKAIFEAINAFNITYVVNSYEVTIEDAALVRFIQQECDRARFSAPYSSATFADIDGEAFLTGMGVLDHIKTEGEVDYHTSYSYEKNPNAGLVEYLLRSLGYYVSVRHTGSEYIYHCEKCDESQRVRDMTIEEIPYEGKVWDITLERNHIFLVRRNGLPVFCGNCGTGNLMRSEGYPGDKLFLSTLLSEDAALVSHQYPDATVFQLDFLQGIDFDSDNTMFLNQLPERLQQIIKNDEPLVIFINPPYAVTAGKGTDVYYHMQSNGYGNAAVDIFHQFLYRLCLIKEFYGLHNLYMGIYGPNNWLLSTNLKNFRSKFFNDFDFRGGFMFAGSEFADVCNSITFPIDVTLWKANQGTIEEEPKILLDTCENVNGEVICTGKQLCRPVEVTDKLEEWVKPKGVLIYQDCPTQTSGYSFGDTLAREPVGTISHMLSDAICRQAVRACSIIPYVVVTHRSIPIMEENYWRCVYSFAIRSALDNFTFTESSQILAAPDTSIEGFESVLADGLAFVIYGLGVYNFSYRDLEVCGRKWNRSNPFFPFSKTACKEIITDPVLLKDMEEHPSNNEITLKALDWALPRMSEEARELMAWGTQYLISTLKGDARAKLDYADWLNAYDAGIMQLRTAAKGALWNDDMMKEYRLVHSKLRTRLRGACYKYGTLTKE